MFQDFPNADYVCFDFIELSKIHHLKLLWRKYQICYLWVWQVFIELPLTILGVRTSIVLQYRWGPTLWPALRYSKQKSSHVLFHAVWALFHLWRISLAENEMGWRWSFYYRQIQLKQNPRNCPHPLVVGCSILNIHGFKKCLSQI